ncbi:MAG: Asp-tRNA(Asn)/Glu-tRNA(Gln) amidotransferase subunit GatC [Pseudomonadota bacterium]
MTDGIDIDHLCALAKLDLPKEELTAARSDLENIVLMVDAMQDVNTEGVEPLSHPIEFPARLREDVVTEQVDPEQFQHNAPDTAAQLFLVPRVVE